MILIPVNNALLIESAAVAQHYQAYWDQLEKDTGAGETSGHYQGAAFRHWAQAHNAAMVDAPIALEDGITKCEVMFSPNTKAALSKSSTAPGDMERVFELMGQAKHAILFLAFDPGNHSILDAAGETLAKNPALFARGALTSTVRAANFSEALHQGDQGNPADMHVAVVGEPGGTHGGGKPQPDYRAIPAGSVRKDDTFGAWEAELYSAGHAIIHDKIVVIDPFDDACVVVTGSHNMGWRASHNNDENFIIIRGHRALAEAYACHVLDVYDHYAWRWWLAKDPQEFGKPLDSTDGWQDHYITANGVKSPEMRFWLAATPSVEAHAVAPARDVTTAVAAKPDPGTRKKTAGAHSHRQPAGAK